MVTGIYCLFLDVCKDEQMKKECFRNKYFWMAVILVVTALAAYFTGLFVDVTRDGSKYAAVAKEVFTSGDFIHLKVHGEAYEQKPPMLFWLSAVSYYIFGVSNFAFKLPLLLLGGLGIYSIYRLGKSMYSRETGALAALLLGTSQVYFLFYMDIHTDTVLQPFVTFSLWQLYEFIKTRKNIRFVLGFTGVGLAMLSKGPVGAVVPAFAVLGHLVFSRQYRRLFDIRWYLGAVITGVVIIPALAGLYNQFGWEGIRFYFWSNNVDRMTTKGGPGNVDYFFYIHNLLYLYIPWMLLLFSSVYFEFRGLIKRRFRSREYFLFSGIWFFFLVLSLSPSKLPNYMFILIPLFSLLTAKYVAIALTGRKQRLLSLFTGIQQVVSVLVFIVLAVLTMYLFPLAHFWQWILLAFFTGIFIYAMFKIHPAFVRLLYPSLAVITALNFFLNQHAAPQIFSDQASVKAAAYFNENAGPDDRIYNYNYDSYELLFYAKDPVTWVYNDVRVIELLNQPGSWIFTEEKVVKRLEGAFPPPEVIPLSHVWINKLRLSYLNPATRQQSRDTLYLMRSTAR